MLKKILIILAVTLFLTSKAYSADLNLVLDFTHAQDGEEHVQDGIIGLELYSKEFGSLLIGAGYSSTKAEIFGAIEEKKSQGIYIRYRAVKKLIDL